MKKNAWLVAGGLLVGAAAIAGGMGKQGKEVTAQERQSAERLVTQFEQAFNQQQADKLAGLYSERGSMGSPMGEPAQGKEEIKQNFREMREGPLKGAKLDIEIKSVQPIDADTLLVDSTYQLTGAQDATMNGAGKSVAVLTREGNQWKIAATRPYPSPEQTGVGGAGMGDMHKQMHEQMPKDMPGTGGSDMGEKHEREQMPKDMPDTGGSGMDDME